jgi:AraC family transcriptional regulator of adaptative response/methylated-DNA-[protein]-cysteine methyltransferase
MLVLAPPEKWCEAPTEGDLMKPTPNHAEMDRAFRSRDGSYDGIFCVAVRTTGVFCRPSCPARKPLPEHVEFYATAKEALFAGYRPCKRCEPLKAGNDLPDWVSALLARVEADPSVRIRDSELRASGVEPAKARRFFLNRFGMTFQAYCRARRLGSAFDEIRSGERLDAVILGHGYESHSGFREAFFKRFGKPPGKTRTEDYIRVGWVETPLGPMVAGASARGICLLEFTDRRMLEAQLDTLARRFGLAIAPGESALIDRLREELGLYFAGRLKRFSVPLDFPGTDFQVEVWRALLGIPYGETRSYEDIARAIGTKSAVRAVGRANGQNRIGIVIPCHRVVNKNGELGGYGGGLWRKKRLLALERGDSFGD